MAKSNYFWDGDDFPRVSGDQLRKEAKNKIRGGPYYMAPTEFEDYEKVSGQELRKQAPEKLKKRKCLYEEDIGTQKMQDEESITSKESLREKPPEPRGNIVIPNHRISLASCAEELCKRAKIINVENRLYVYNQKCYESLKPIELITLYRSKVSDSLHGSKSIKMFASDLYEYLLSDSRLMWDGEHTDCSDFAVLENGIYDIRKQKLLPHDPKYFVLSYVKAKYIENPKCERYDKFLDTVTDGGKVLKKRSWQTLGYTLSQSTDAKKFIFMGMAPNSGKSVKGQLVGALFPEKFVSHIALTDMNKEFALGPLVGSAVNISLDLPQVRLNSSAVSLIKQLTGNDSITINEKYVPQFKYRNRAKFIFASNHPITISGEDSAFWDRVLYLPFEVSIPRENQNMRLLEELLQEKDAIVSKALHKSQELWENKYEFPTTPDIERTVNRWRGQTDDGMDYFINTCCELDGKSITVLDYIYKAYCRCCEQRGTRPESSKRLKDYLENQKGLTHKKDRCGESNPRSAMKGIRLL